VVLPFCVCFHGTNPGRWCCFPLQRERIRPIGGCHVPSWGVDHTHGFSRHAPRSIPRALLSTFGAVGRGELLADLLKGAPCIIEVPFSALMASRRQTNRERPCQGNTETSCARRARPEPDQSTVGGASPSRWICSIDHSASGSDAPAWGPGTPGGTQRVR